jgi:Bacteriophage related domain of unknown function
VIEIRNALETRLNAMSPPFPTAWENSGYVPQVGTPYQAVYLLPAQTENPTFAGTGQELAFEQGIFQISIYEPKSGGTQAAALRAAAIRDQFKRGLSLSSGGVTVVIARTASIASALLEADWYVLPVSIPYFAHVFQ